MTSTAAAAGGTVVVDVQPHPLARLPPNKNNDSPAPPQDGRLTFPRDFPKVPPGGVTLIAFKDFKERGIAYDPRPDDPEGLEVDTLGIPTVVMKEHATDQCKTRTKRKDKRVKQEKQKYLDANQEVPWWVEWAEGEGNRIAKPTNASDSKMTRFLAAARDFRTSRKWPLPRNHQTDVSYIWTLLQVYLGIEVAVAKKDRPSRKKVFKEPLRDDEDESSDEDMDDDFDDDIFDSDDEGGEFGSADPHVKKTRQFLANPEKTINIFLSSYIRAKGVIWSRINLEQTPRLCIYFLEFLLRSRTLPGLEPGLRSAVDVAKQALIELPLTGGVSESFPDEFSQGCNKLWDQKTQVFKQVELDTEWLAQLAADNKAQEEAEKAEREAQGESGDAPVLTEPEQAEGGVMEVEQIGDGWDATPGWGATGSTGWDTGGWGADEAAFKPDDAGEANQWVTAPENQPCLLRLLGPTALPLTHTTGVVEQSFRRITQLIPVPTNIPPKSNVSKDDPWVADPAGVEMVLERTFPQAVLSPWLNWDGGEWPGYAEPRILEASQGPVVDPPYAKKEEGAAAATTTPGPKPHDPGNDPITVLIHPSVFDKLVLGMCLAGTWVQIVRQPVDASAPAAPKKKGKGKKKAPANFWYLDELGGVFPSFWATKAT
ncbi:hypothetical protein NMY22_g18070 [Coprinellus aureogranulatus]|nr:hypothetical protein NMY22_g18070 [Coprinellus aureogranulatus]